MGGLGSWSLLFPKQTVAVISARYLPAFQTRAIHLRAEAFTTSEEDAHALTEKTSAFLSLFHAAERQRWSARHGCGCKGIFRESQSRTVRRSCNSDRNCAGRIHPQGFDRKLSPRLRPLRSCHKSLTSDNDSRRSSSEVRPNECKRKCCINSRPTASCTYEMSSFAKRRTHAVDTIESLCRVCPYAGCLRGRPDFFPVSLRASARARIRLLNLRRRRRATGR